MSNLKIIRQLEELKSEADYQLKYDPDNDIWIDDYNALQSAIDIVQKDRSVEYFWKGAAVSFILWILIYILYHL